MSGIQSLKDRRKHFSGHAHIGQLFKGDPKPASGDRPGKDTEHFRYAPMPGWEHTAKFFEDNLGKCPDRINNVYLLHDGHPDDIFAMKEFTKIKGVNKLVRICDEVSCSLHYDFEQARYIRESSPCLKDLPVNERCSCKPAATLRLIIPALEEALNIPCYVTLEITAKNEHTPLYSHLCLVYEQLQAYNKHLPDGAQPRTLADVPFTLFRQTRMITRKGQIKPSSASLVNLWLADRTLLPKPTTALLQEGEINENEQEAIEGEIDEIPGGQSVETQDDLEVMLEAITLEVFGQDLPVTLDMLELDYDTVMQIDDFEMIKVALADAAVSQNVAICVDWIEIRNHRGNMYTLLDCGLCLALLSSEDEALLSSIGMSYGLGVGRYRLPAALSVKINQPEIGKFRVIECHVI